MFGGMRKKQRDYFPKSIEEQVLEGQRVEWLKEISSAQGKHTIVRAKKKRPTIQSLQEVSKLE